MSLISNHALPSTIPCHEPLEWAPNQVALWTLKMRVLWVPPHSETLNDCPLIWGSSGLASANRRTAKLHAPDWPVQAREQQSSRLGTGLRRLEDSLSQTLLDFWGHCNLYSLWCAFLYVHNSQEGCCISVSCYKSLLPSTFTAPLRGSHLFNVSWTISLMIK